MKTIEESEKEIMDEFAIFDDWLDKYNHIIEIGKELPDIDPIYKTEQYSISGCQSQVWLHASFDGEKIRFTAGSDAIITKGIIGLLINVLSNRTPDEIINAKLEYIEKLGLKEHLSPTRSNGLASMVKQIKLYAMAFKSKTAKQEDK